MKKYQLLFTFIFLTCFGRAQIGYYNIDFENGHFTNWNGAYNNSVCGTLTPNPMPIGGIDSLGTPPQYAIVSTGFDPSVTLASLPVNSPFGGNFSVRLGDTIDGCGAAQITYYINVIPTVSDKVAISCACVFNDSGTYAFANAPKFMYNFLSPSTSDCLTYPAGVTYCDTIVFSPTDSSFLHASSSLSTLYYRNWQTLCFDLTPFIGTTIPISFTSSDADDGLHLGYAYVDCQFYSSSCSGTTNLHQITDLSASISVYPNPASNCVNLSLKSLQSDEFEITLCDIQGAILMKDNFASALEQINKTYKTENLPRGIYFVSIKTKKQGTIQKKVIIN
jgi:hypothetical protein